jgi:hypothetical protein
MPSERSSTLPPNGPPLSLVILQAASQSNPMRVGSLLHSNWRTTNKQTSKQTNRQTSKQTNKQTNQHALNQHDWALINRQLMPPRNVCTALTAVASARSRLCYIERSDLVHMATVSRWRAGRQCSPARMASLSLGDCSVSRSHPCSLNLLLNRLKSRDILGSLCSGIRRHYSSMGQLLRS